MFCGKSLIAAKNRRSSSLSGKSEFPKSSSFRKTNFFMLILGHAFQNNNNGILSLFGQDKSFSELDSV